MKTLLYPGSFDPVTCGHMDMIARASALCDTLVVAVMHNPDKKGCFSPDRRRELLEKACAPMANVRVVVHDGLLIDCAREYGAQAVIRGVRPIGDFDGEYQMAQINRMLGGVETLLMTTGEAVSNISSSMVRQIAGFGGNIHGLVPQQVETEIADALKGGR